MSRRQPKPTRTTAYAPCIDACHSAPTSASGSSMPTALVTEEIETPPTDRFDDLRERPLVAEQPCESNPEGLQRLAVLAEGAEHAVLRIEVQAVCELGGDVLHDVQGNGLPGVARAQAADLLEELVCGFEL